MNNKSSNIFYCISLLTSAGVSKLFRAYLIHHPDVSVPFRVEQPRRMVVPHAIHRIFVSLPPSRTRSVTHTANKLLLIHHHRWPKCKPLCWLWAVEIAFGPQLNHTYLSKTANRVTLLTPTVPSKTWAPEMPLSFCTNSRRSPGL